MPVHAAVTTAPPPVVVQPPPPHDGTTVRSPRLATRRTVLGLLGGAGAAAAATRLSGALVDVVTADTSGSDPRGALSVGVTGLTTGLDRAAAAAGHGRHTTPDEASADRTAPDALGVRVWSLLATVHLVVRNRSTADVLFSPGQVRLRLADGTGVMPVDSERPAGPLAGLTTTRTWVRFLAPQEAGALSVDFLPAGETDPLPLPVVTEPGHGHGSTR